MVKSMVGMGGGGTKEWCSVLFVWNKKEIKARNKWGQAMEILNFPRDVNVTAIVKNSNTGYECFTRIHPVWELGRMA